MRLGEKEGKNAVSKYVEENLYVSTKSHQRTVEVYTVSVWSACSWIDLLSSVHRSSL